MAVGGAGVRLRGDGRPAHRIRFAVQGVRPVRLHQGDQLRSLVRSARRGQSEQSRLHQSWPSGAHRQSISRSGADVADPVLYREHGRWRRVQRCRRFCSRGRAAGRKPGRFPAAEFMPGALRICRLVRRAAAVEASDDRTWTGRRTDLYPLQQPFVGADGRCALRRHGRLLQGLSPLRRIDRGSVLRSDVQA